MIASSVLAVTPEGLLVFGIPVDFILFGLTLLGVAVFHHHTLRVALGGLAMIALYKIMFTGFKTGPGVTGFVSHVGHEWVILANLLGLTRPRCSLPCLCRRSRSASSPDR